MRKFLKGFNWDLLLGWAAILLFLFWFWRWVCLQIIEALK